MNLTTQVHNLKIDIKYNQKKVELLLQTGQVEINVHVCSDSFNA